MSPRIVRCARAAATSLGIALAGMDAPAYQVSASAGSEGEVVIDPNDPDASASLTEAENGGVNFVEASADAASGTLFARISRDFSDGNVPYPVDQAAGRIRETIRFTASPPGPVTLGGRLSFGSELTLVQAANAAASGHLGLGPCDVTASRDPSGINRNARCNVSGGSEGGNDTVYWTLPAASVTPSFTVAVEGDAVVNFTSAPGSIGIASASARIDVWVDGTDAYEFDSPLSFTVPEPASGAAGVAALSGLALAARRSRLRRAQVARPQSAARTATPASDARGSGITGTAAA
jgi:hypothetical protein